MKRRLFAGNMLKIMSMVFILIVMADGQCNNTGAITLATQYQHYLTAQPLNLSQ